MKFARQKQARPTGRYIEDIGHPNAHKHTLTSTGPWALPHTVWPCLCTAVERHRVTQGCPGCLPPSGPPIQSPYHSTAKEEGEHQVGAPTPTHRYLAAPSSVVARSTCLYPLTPLSWFQLLCPWLCDQGRTSLCLLPTDGFASNYHRGHEGLGQ